MVRDYDEFVEDNWDLSIYEVNTNDGDEVPTPPLYIFDLLSHVYFDDSPSGNLSNIYFGIDYLNQLEDGKLDLIK
jgi:hypothetical protein